MTVENQNLLEKVNATISKIEQKISFRPKGKSSKWTEELITARAKKAEILANINRENNIEDLDLDLDEVAKQGEALEVLTKENKELAEKIKAQSLYVDILTNQRPEKVFSEISPRPDFTEIGREMIKTRQLDKKLKKLQAVFDSAKQKSENTSPVGTGKRASAVQISRNALNLVKQEVEKFPQLVEFYELRAEAKYLKKITEELREIRIEQEAYMVELENEFSLLEKHGFIKTKS